MLTIIKASAFLFAFILLGACQSSKNVAIINLEPQEFSTQLNLKKDSALLIDVRTPEEFQSGHLPGALLMDFQDPGFENRLSQISKEKAIFVYCRSGRRSQASADLFSKAGFKSVTNLTPGILGWQSKNLPIILE